jgi:hypothetical protein
MKYVLGLNALENPSHALQRRSGFKHATTGLKLKPYKTTAVSWHVMLKQVSW